MREPLVQETVAGQAAIADMTHHIEARTAEAAEMTQHVERARDEIGRLAGANAELTAARDAMIASRSWRLTAPLRRLVAWKMRLARVEGRPG